MTLSPALCPCCGQQIAPLTLAVCLESNVATRFGREVKLTPQQAVMLHVLCNRNPRTSSFAYIASKIWGMGNTPEGENDTIRVMISQLRRRLAPLFVRIESQFGIGYRLVLDELPALAEVA